MYFIFQFKSRVTKAKKKPADDDIGDEDEPPKKRGKRKEIYGP